MQKSRKLTALIAVALVLALTVALAVPGFASSLTKTINATYMDVKIYLNGGEVVPTNANGEVVEPFVSDGTTYLPVRAVANAFGADVAWDNDTKTVYLTDPDVRVLGLDPITQNGGYASFLTLLTAITGADLSAFNGKTATAANVAAAANTAVGLTELVNAFTVRGVADADVKAAKAAELLPDTYGETFTAAELNDTAFRVAAYSGLLRGYVGKLSDDDIITKLDTVWNTIPAVLNDDLKDIGGQVLDTGVITGFNIRNSAYAVAFDPALTLLYSHTSLTHVKQLLMLVKSQGIDARIALEPKTSWYYWEGLVYDQEYDVKFEFATAADKAAFNALVKDYAQKKTGSENTDLLSSSWWTPLYASATPVDDAYVEMENNTFYFAGTNFYITSYGPKGELSDAIVAEFEALGATTQQSPLYANADFSDWMIEMLVPAETTP